MTTSQFDQEDLLPLLYQTLTHLNLTTTANNLSKEAHLPTSNLTTNAAELKLLCMNGAWKQLEEWMERNIEKTEKRNLEIERTKAEMEEGLHGRRNSKVGKTSSDTDVAEQSSQLLLTQSQEDIDMEESSRKFSTPEPETIKKDEKQKPVQSDHTKWRLMIRKLKFRELIQQAQPSLALTVLQEEIANLETNQEEIGLLCTALVQCPSEDPQTDQITLPNVEAASKRTGLESTKETKARDSARQALLHDLQREFLPS